MEFVNKVLPFFNRIHLDNILSDRNDLTPRERYFSVNKFGRRGDDGYSYIDFCKLFKYLKRTGKCGAASLNISGFLSLLNTTNSIIVYHPSMEERITNKMFFYDNLNIRKPNVVLFDCSVKESEAYVLKFNEKFFHKDKLLNIKESGIELKKFRIIDDEAEKKVEENVGLPRTPTFFPDHSPEIKDFDDPVLKEKEIKKQSKKRLLLPQRKNISNDLEGIDNSYTVKIQRLQAIDKSRDEFCDYVVDQFKNEVPIRIGDTIVLEFDNRVDCDKLIPGRSSYPAIEIDSQKCMEEKIYDRVAAHAKTAYEELGFPLEIKATIVEQAEEKTSNIIKRGTSYVATLTNTSIYAEKSEDEFVSCMLDQFKSDIQDSLEYHLSMGNSVYVNLHFVDEKYNPKIETVDITEAGDDPIAYVYEKLEDVLRDAYQKGIPATMAVHGGEKK